MTLVLAAWCVLTTAGRCRLLLLLAHFISLLTGLQLETAWMKWSRVPGCAIAYPPELCPYLSHSTDFFFLFLVQLFRRLRFVGLSVRYDRYFTRPVSHTLVDLHFRLYSLAIRTFLLYRPPFLSFRFFGLLFVLCYLAFRTLSGPSLGS